MGPDYSVTKEMQGKAWLELDRLLLSYYDDSQDRSFTRTIAKLTPHIIKLTDWYDNYRQYIDFKTYLIMVGPIISNYASVLGAAKDLCIARDGLISRHVRANDVLLERIHSFNEDYSIELMTSSPAAYQGIYAPWTSPAKICL